MHTRANPAPIRMAHTLLAALLLALAALLLPAAGSAREATPIAADPALEARVMEIAEELRCLVCQNETIAASHADLAVDLRAQIRERLSQGESAKQIRDFMVERYGNFVLYRPPVEPATWLLWGGPFLLLLLGFGIWALMLRSRRRDTAPDPAAVTTVDERRRRQLDHALREAVEPPK